MHYYYSLLGILLIGSVSFFQTPDQGLSAFLPLGRTVTLHRAPRMKEDAPRSPYQFHHHGPYSSPDSALTPTTKHAEAVPCSGTASGGEKEAMPIEFHSCTQHHDKPLTYSLTSSLHFHNTPMQEKVLHPQYADKSTVLERPIHLSTVTWSDNGRSRV